MRKIAFVALAVLGAGIFSGVSAYTNRGNITADETWGPSDGLIRLSSDVTVTSGATLTILPGTNVRTTASLGCNVNVRGTGVIRAVGTETSVISFLNVRVEFQDLTRDSLNLLEYCSFNSGSGHALVEFRNTSTPTTENELSHATIRNCTLQNGGYCIVYITSGASPTFENCYFAGGNTGIFSHGSDTLTVRNCRFTDVGCAIVSGALGNSFYEPMVCNVDHCTFSHIHNGRTVPSYLTPCQGMAICSVNEPGELNVTNCVFNDIAGSGIRDWNIEDPNFAENWVVTNDYNIFYDTGGDPCYLFDMGANSLEADPLLGTAPDYALGSGSPAIDAASDGSNMGAWQEPVSSVRPAVAAAAAAGDGITVVVRPGIVAFTLPGVTDGQLSVFDAAGARIVRIPVRDARAEWRTDRTSGVYFVRSVSGTTSFVKL